MDMASRFFLKRLDLRKDEVKQKLDIPPISAQTQISTCVKCVVHTTQCIGYSHVGTPPFHKSRSAT